jgi:RNA polymerase Rpb4
MDGFETAVLIGNAEVLELLKSRLSERRRKLVEPSPALSQQQQQRYGKPHKKLQHRDWIEEKVHDYLQSTPCVRLMDASRRLELQTILRSSSSSSSSSSSRKQTTTIATATTTTTSKKTRGFDLTEAESLQILNFMPTEPVEIHLVIEELHARMSEKEQDELLALIDSYVMHDDPDDVGDCGDESIKANGVVAGPGNSTTIMAMVTVKQEDDFDHVAVKNGYN